MHGWMKWAFALLYPSRDIATNSKAIASYTQTVMQLDKASIFENLHGGNDFVL